MKGYQQPNLSTNRSVCAMFVIGLCNWTVSVICACCCSAFCRVKCFFPHENVYLMASIFLKICHSFDQLVTGPHLIQLCEIVLIINKSDSDFVNHSYDFTDWIGLYSFHYHYKWYHSTKPQKFISLIVLVDKPEPKQV